MSLKQSRLFGFGGIKEKLYCGFCRAKAEVEESRQEGEIELLRLSCGHVTLRDLSGREEIADRLMEERKRERKKM